MKLPKDILEFKDLFTENNRKLFVVGGAVRDFMLGKEPNDFDLVTDAQPNEIKKILSKFNTDLQGEHFGVIRVFTDDEPLGHEIATFRNDIANGRDTKSDGEKVEIGSHITIEDDVKRRDFTINALFFDIETETVVDLVGGINDIDKGIIRTVGHANDRFREDRLRILRALRFSATMDFQLDDDIIYQLSLNSKLFGISDKVDVSKERIVAELFKVEEKAIKNNDSEILVKYFSLLNLFKILTHIIPCGLHTSLIPSKSLTIIIAQLFSIVNDEKLIIELLKDAKFPHKFITNVITLLEFKNGVVSKNILKLKKSFRISSLTDRDLFEWFRMQQISTDSLEQFLAFKTTVNGNDIIKEGFKNNEIGIEINKREIENFKKHIKEWKF